MRRWRAVLVTVLGCLLITGAATTATGEAASDPNARRDDVVALVLAQDDRFAGLPDYERQRIKQQSQFSFDPIVGSGFYRTLPTLASSVTPWMFDFGYSANWLVEVTLVQDCTPLPTADGPSSDTAPWPDPCAWRHSWFYRVEPDDTVALLFEEGDPEPAPAG